MRDVVISVLTVAVLGWAGANLFVGTRRAVRRRSDTAELLPGLRLRHRWPALRSTRSPLGQAIVVVGLVVASVALTGCSDRGRDLRLTSPDLRAGSRLDERFTCTGDNVVPTLRWSGAPSGTRGWAVVVEDPDAPSGTFTHWVVTGLGATTRSVGATLPPGAVAGLTSSGQAGYVGPCPPTGQEHRFRYRVHALREPLELGRDTQVPEARRRIEALSLDAAEVEVTYRTP